MPEMAAARVMRRLKLSSVAPGRKNIRGIFSFPLRVPCLRSGKAFLSHTSSESDKSDPVALNHIATLLQIKRPTARGFDRVLMNGHCSRSPREALALIGSSHGAGVPTLLRPARPLS